MEHQTEEMGVESEATMDTSLQRLGNSGQTIGNYLWIADVIVAVDSLENEANNEATNGWKWKTFMAIFFMQLAYYSMLLLTINHKKLHDTSTFWWDLATPIVGMVDLHVKTTTKTRFTRTDCVLYLCNIFGYFPWIVVYKLCMKAVIALGWTPYHCTDWLMLLPYLIVLRVFFIVTVHGYLDILKDRMSRHYIRCIAILTFKFVVLTLFWVHFVGCFYFGLAMIWFESEDTWLGSLKIDSNKTYDFNNEPEWKNYGICFYYSMTTVTTLGYGDIHPVNILEMYVTPVMLLINLVVMTLIGSHSIGPLLARIFHRETNELRKQD